MTPNMAAQPDSFSHNIEFSLKNLAQNGKQPIRPQQQGAFYVGGGQGIQDPKDSHSKKISHFPKKDDGKRKTALFWFSNLGTEALFKFLIRQKELLTRQTVFLICQIDYLVRHNESCGNGKESLGNQNVYLVQWIIY